MSGTSGSVLLAAWRLHGGAAHGLLARASIPLGAPLGRERLELCRMMLAHILESTALRFQSPLTVQM